MNTGVSMTPCQVVSRPRLAGPSVRKSWKSNLRKEESKKNHRAINDREA
jgi:hypothetical protein